jgi:hypothetical protein
MLISDYSSGVVRRLFAVTDTEFAMGTGFNSPTPLELTVRFAKGKQGAVSGIQLRRADGTESFANRVALRKETASFEPNDNRS